MAKPQNSSRATLCRSPRLDRTCDLLQSSAVRTRKKSFQRLRSIGGKLHPDYRLGFGGLKTRRWGKRSLKSQPSGGGMTILLHLVWSPITPNRAAEISPVKFLLGGATVGRARLWYELTSQIGIGKTTFGKVRLKLMRRSS